MANTSDSYKNNKNNPIGRVYSSPIGPRQTGGSAVKNAAYTNAGVRDKGKVTKTANPYRPSTNQIPMSVTGGLGIRPYNNPKPSYRAGPAATTALRDYQYGVPAPKAAPKSAPKKVTEITIPGGGLKTGSKSSGGVKTVSQAQKMAPGNYSSGKLSMGGKNYTGFTVTSKTDSKGRTTKSVGNWSSGGSARAKADKAMGTTGNRTK